MTTFPAKCPGTVLRPPLWPLSLPHAQVQQDLPWTAGCHAQPGGLNFACHPGVMVGTGVPGSRREHPWPSLRTERPCVLGVAVKGTGLSLPSSGWGPLMDLPCHHLSSVIFLNCKNLTELLTSKEFNIWQPESPSYPNYKACSNGAVF